MCRRTYPRRTNADGATRVFGHGVKATVGQRGERRANQGKGLLERGKRLTASVRTSFVLFNFDVPNGGNTGLIGNAAAPLCRRVVVLACDVHKHFVCGANADSRPPLVSTVGKRARQAQYL